MMFCGTGSFKDVDKAAAPEAVKKKKQAGGKKENPYASRGLDKFSTVLSELESRREKILRRVGSGAGEGGGGGHVMVRFVQSEGKGWVPVIVKLPPEEQEQQRRAGGKKRKQAASPTSSQSSTPPTSEPSSPREDVKVPAPAPAAGAVAPVRRKAAAVAGERWSWSWGKNVRPRHYMPFVAVLLLASLVVFGRVFAICCTSVWWYLVPILTTGRNGAGGEAHGARRATKAAVKVLGKKASDKKIAGEKPVAAPLLAPSHGKKGSSGVHELISPRSHPHGKKG
ncbi:uncharacterized protein LOC107304624 [Oryza brachyantha]|uniref:ZCF37 n=1 Tax=Oryza brachyantha TaxID=4533 RepID=J3MMH2_ORYBR|nr:uncharacterized protein LOC107304624 [Oryza brachyantha]